MGRLQWALTRSLARLLAIKRFNRSQNLPLIIICASQSIVIITIIVLTKAGRPSWLGEQTPDLLVGNRKLNLLHSSGGLPLRASSCQCARIERPN